MEEYQFTTLNEDEMNRVNGAQLANGAGAIAGGVGGFFGAIISGGQDATAEDLAIGAFSGFIAGGLNPVRGFGSLATTLGGTIVGSGASSLADDMIQSRRLRY